MSHWSNSLRDSSARKKNSATKRRWLLCWPTRNIWRQLEISRPMKRRGVIFSNETQSGEGNNVKLGSLSGCKSLVNGLRSRRGSPEDKAP